MVVISTFICIFAELKFKFKLLWMIFIISPIE